MSSSSSLIGPDAPGIYLLSPAGAIIEPERIARARENLHALGYRTVLDPAALERDTRFAGTDVQRLAAFERALHSDCDIVMATRGGYGMTRLLPYLDFPALAESGKRFVGHSDFTAFHLAMLARTGTVTWAGPMASYDFGGETVDDLTADLFGEAMRGELEILSFESADADPVDARGMLWGGNLALVAALVGTPYFPQVGGGILFLEDINESAYRVERMLVQLLQADVLQRQKAIVFGAFTDMPSSRLDEGYGLAQVIAWLRSQIRVPILTGLPFGHVPLKATLPVGAQVGIAAEEGMVHLVLREHDHDHHHEDDSDHEHGGEHSAPHEHHSSHDPDFHRDHE